MLVLAFMLLRSCLCYSCYWICCFDWYEYWIYYWVNRY